MGDKNNEPSSDFRPSSPQSSVSMTYSSTPLDSHLPNTVNANELSSPKHSEEANVKLQEQASAPLYTQASTDKSYSSPKHDSAARGVTTSFDYETGKASDGTPPRPKGTSAILKQLRTLGRKMTNIVSPRKCDTGVSTSNFGSEQSSLMGSATPLSLLMFDNAHHSTSPTDLSILPMARNRRSSSHELPGYSPTYIGAYRQNYFVCEGVRLLLRTFLKLLEEHGDYSKIVVGLSGGSTPKRILSTLSALCNASVGPSCPRCLNDTEHKGDTQHGNNPCGGPSDLSTVDWSRIVIFLVDERYVPADDPRSNQRMIRDTLLLHESVNIPENNIIFPDTTLPLDECVEDYHTRLLNVFSTVGGPHLVTLGLGDDGHTASWFPPLSEADLLTAYNKERLVVHTVQERFEVRDRITVSMHVLCAAGTKLFLLNGESKVEKWKTLITASPKSVQGGFSDLALREEPVLQILQTSDVFVLSCPPIISDEFKSFHEAAKSSHLSIVIFGASGDLARRKTL